MIRSIIPNTLSLSRVFFALVFYGTTVRYPLAPVWLLIVLFFFIELSDLFDGMAARAFGSVSDTGKLLDPMCDTGAHFLCLFSMYVLFMVPGIVLVIFILRELWVLFLRANLARNGIVFSARFSGKIKTWVYAIALFCSIALLPQSALSAKYPTVVARALVYLPMLYYGGAVLSIFSGLCYAVKAWFLTRQENSKKSLGYSNKHYDDTPDDIKHNL